MKIGTKSILFGAHAFWLHPWFVALAWWKLYGFPWDPRLWVAFFVHDLGYIGKAYMDDADGETHPVLGAHIMSKLFDRGFPKQAWIASVGMCSDPDESVWQKDGIEYGRWGQFALLHSRYYAKRLGQQPSRLCAADKLAIALTPAWLYLPMVRATGEIHEYRLCAIRDGVLSGASSHAEWFAGVQHYCRQWAYAHCGGAVDTWTPLRHADR